MTDQESFIDMRAPAILVLLGAIAAAPVAVQAQELPTRKAGLWESTTGMSGAPAMTVKQCIDAKTDQLAQAAVQPGMTCSKREVKKTATGYELNNVCEMGAMKVEAKGLITGDFVSKVKVDMTTSMTGIPGQAGPMTTTLSIDSSRTGDCGAGQAPGDIIMPNGQIIKTPGSK